MKPIKLSRSGGYDPKLGPKHPDNRDPSLEIARPQLPAITVAIVKIGEKTTAHRAQITIPRADPTSWMLAHRAAAELCEVIAEHGGSNMRHAATALPTIEVGRHNTCVTVAIACRDAFEAADVAELLDIIAPKIARDAAGFATHRVVRAP